VIRIGVSPAVLVVGANSPYRTVGELVAAARGPGKPAEALGGALACRHAEGTGGSRAAPLPFHAETGALIDPSPTPESFTRLVAEETARMRQVIEKNHITIE